jgi:hypothetical protein
MSRPYTGTKDAVAKGARAGTKQFQALMAFLFQMRSLGIFANRSVRGSSSLSVHATGRAADLGGKPEQVRAAIDFLNAFRLELGVECIHDYRNVWIPGEYGAAYRCSRDNGGLLAGWRVYDRPTIGKGGNWVHYEISPDMADDPDAVTKAFTDILDRIVAALEGNK